MAATVEFSETNGAAGSPTTTDGIANINFGTVDSPNITPASHPIIVGGFSFGKWLRFHVSAMGGSTAVSNLRFYKSSGAYVTGEVIGGNPNDVSSDNSYNITSYAHATTAAGGGLVTVPVTGNGSTVLSNAYSILPVPTSLPAHNVSIGNAVAGSIIAAGYSDYIFLGLATTGSTPAGAVNQKVFSLTFDET